MLLASFLLKSCSQPAVTGKQVSITVEDNKKGAPITLGIPFPKGELNSVDHLRLLTSDGTEIPCQTTEVSNWGPVDDSVKWVWVFFFRRIPKTMFWNMGTVLFLCCPKRKSSQPTI